MYSEEWGKDLSAEMSHQCDCLPQRFTVAGSEYVAWRKSMTTRGLQDMRV